jgi:hypothetical protein
MKLQLHLLLCLCQSTLVWAKKPRVLCATLVFTVKCLTFDLDFSVLWILMIARYILDQPKIYVLIFFQGYRVISIDVPQVWNHHEWIHSFEKFLDSMNIHHVRNIVFFPFYEAVSLAMRHNLICFHYFLKLGARIVYPIHFSLYEGYFCTYNTELFL